MEKQVQISKNYENLTNPYIGISCTGDPGLYSLCKLILARPPPRSGVGGG